MARCEANELKEFIDYSLSKGISREQVQKMLLENGWPEDVIGKIFVKRENLGTEFSTGKSLLKLSKISKSYGSNIVLENVDLSINPGEIFGIIGLSGSGKTTLLNTIVGFVEPDEGEIIIKSPKDKNDYLVSKNLEVVKEIFGFAAQHPSFYDKLTAGENIAYFSSLYNIPKKERKERCNALIRMVGLQDSEKVLAQNLSGGMQKRLDIACSLVHNPKILILDEPTADLDPVSREEMWGLVKHINSQGTTVIIASHFVAELEELCSRFGILHNRCILKVGTANELRSSYSKNHEIILEVKSRKYDKIIKGLKAKKALQVQKITITNNVLTIFTPKPEQTLYHLAKMIESMDEKIIDISVNKPTIKELFESLVKK